MRTPLHYQLCAAINLSFQKVNLRVDSKSMFPGLQFTGLDEFKTTILGFFGIQKDMQRTVFD